MILFFETPQKSIIATETEGQLSKNEIQELCWLYGEASLIDAERIEGNFVGPRREW